MPCLFLENVPGEIKWNKDFLEAFHEAVFGMIGDNIEVHIRQGVTYSLLTIAGEIPALDHGVHGFIHWHEGRNRDKMLQLGTAIQALLDYHTIGEGFDLTFIPGRQGMSFYFDRKMVE